jgi:hypothetical protein
VSKTIVTLILCSASAAWADGAWVPREPKEAALAVRRLVNRASLQQSSRLTIETEATVGWGCPCAPLILTTGGDQSSALELFVLPVFNYGVLDATRYGAPGLYFVLTGSYTGRIRTVPEYRREKNERTEEGIHDAQPAPEFSVESWCYSMKPSGKKSRRRASKNDAEDLVDQLERMRRDGAQPCAEPKKR